MTVALEISAALPSFIQTGNLLVMSNANVRVEYNLGNGRSDFFWKNSRKITGFYSGVGLGSFVTGMVYSNRTHAIVTSNEVVVTSFASGLPTMKQHFTLDHDDSFLTRVEMTGSRLHSNWMGPVVVDTTGGVDIGSHGDDRALYVPFDNDHFVRYNAMPINTTSNSYEVCAFYDNATRNGLVVGSVTHDTWKTGISFQGASNKLNELKVYGGATSSTATWDVMAHGSVVGDTISSPTVFVGFGEDWRTTMEQFADANAAVAPKLTWSGGVPFGWNSWFAFGSTVNHAKAIAVSDFIKDNLQTNHFNDHGVVYVNLAYFLDNLSAPELVDFVNHCHANGQKAGIYWSPFVWWGAPSKLTNSTVKGSAYKYSDVALRDGNGNIQTNDSAIAMDPTHPGIRQRTDYFLNQFISQGFDYIKLDFLSHGAMEGVHYDTNVTTGIQAYNQGMHYILGKLGGRMFISESIAPIFPYHYAHARRIACDTGKSIGETEYEMESVTSGWWISGRLYQYSDPDVMKFAGVSGAENQSRLVSGAVSGTVFLNSDDLTVAANQSLALSCLTNNAINEVAGTGRTFKAVEGNNGTVAGDVFVRQDGASWCLAVFNYGGTATNKTVDFARAGISGTYTAVDLWSGATSATIGTSMNVSLNARQAKLFRLWHTPPALLNARTLP
jgi:alpha-galactosidase